MIIKNSVTKVFQLLLLLSPIVVGADIDMDMFDLIFFRTGVIILFMASLIDEPKRKVPEYVNKIIFGLFGLCIFNIFVHTFAPIVMMVTMNIFLAIVGLYIVYTYLDEKSNLIKYILWAGLINLIFLISQRTGFDPVFSKIPRGTDKDPWYYAGAFLGNAPRLGTYFALLIPFLPIWLFPLAIIISIFIIKQYVMLIPIVVILLVRIKSILLKAGIILLGAISIFILREHILSSLMLRFNSAYKPGLEYFFDRPLIGYGLGTIVSHTFDVISTSYVQFILGVGVLGLVWLGYVFNIIRKKITVNKESAALVSLSLIAFIEYPLEIIRLWYLIIAITAIFIIKSEVII